MIAMSITSPRGADERRNTPSLPYLKSVGEASPREFVLSWYTTSIGAEPHNHLQIMHPSISPRHAQIIRHHFDRYFISDLGSATGTFVNGRRIGGSKRIRSADAIQRVARVLLDPFYGSSSTLVFAQKAGRRDSAIELDPSIVMHGSR
jgi:hypothetical protein